MDRGTRNGGDREGRAGGARRSPLFVALGCLVTAGAALLFVADLASTSGPVLALVALTVLAVVAIGYAQRLRRAPAAAIAPPTPAPAPAPATDVLAELDAAGRDAVREGISIGLMGLLVVAWAVVAVVLAAVVALAAAALGAAEGPAAAAAGYLMLAAFLGPLVVGPIASWRVIARRRAASERRTADQAVAAASSSDRCPGCGAPRRADDPDCQFCGFRFGGGTA